MMHMMKQELDKTWVRWCTPQKSQKAYQALTDLILGDLTVPDREVS